MAHTALKEAAIHQCQSVLHTVGALLGPLANETLRSCGRSDQTMRAPHARAAIRERRWRRHSASPGIRFSHAFESVECTNGGEHMSGVCSLLPTRLEESRRA